MVLAHVIILSVIGERLNKYAYRVQLYVTCIILDHLIGRQRCTQCGSTHLPL